MTTKPKEKIDLLFQVYIIKTSDFSVSSTFSIVPGTMSPTTDSFSTQLTKGTEVMNPSHLALMVMTIVATSTTSQQPTTILEIILRSAVNAV